MSILSLQGILQHGIVLAFLWIGTSTAMRPEARQLAVDGDATNHSEGADLSSQTPCIHVLTYDRPKSFSRLLAQLNELDYGKDSGHVRLTISIDYPYDEEADGVDLREQTVVLAQQFEFKHGEKVVNARTKHAGLIKQWLEAWMPEEDMADQRPACMILEDDLAPSKFAWTWMREALAAYGNKTDRIASFGLNAPWLVAATESSRGLGDIPPRETGQPFLYKYFSTWGLIALRARWTDFRKYMDANYVDGRSKDITFEGKPIMPSMWHNKKPHQVWSYWFIRFMDEKGLFTLYSNVDTNTSLCVNFREPGLHFPVAEALGPESDLLEADAEALHNFPALRELLWLDWDAKPATLDFKL